MTIHEDVQLAIPASTPNAETNRGGLLEWPRVVWIYGIGLALLYVPTVVQASHAWISNPNYSQGFLIFPVAIFLLWLQRGEIAAAERRPTLWGLVPLALGLLLYTAGELLQLKYIGMWSLVPTLAGAVLLMHGPSLWRITRFAICFLLFASAIPNTLLSAVSLWIKEISITGAVELTRTLGVPLVRMGNIIRVPNTALEVADVCSGYNKLIALLAFGALYGYMVPVGRSIRLLLVAAAVPIAVLVNALRIAVLIIIGNSGGTHALHIAHNWAEGGALLLAFGLYLLLGRILGCDAIRFTR